MRLIAKHLGSLYKRINRIFSYPYDIYRRKGSFFLLNRNTMMDDGIIKFKKYEDNLISNAINTINRNNISHVYDIGSNIGMYTVQLGKLPSVKHISSFEPFPTLFLQIGANVLINNLADKWQGHQCAISDYDGTADLHYHPYFLGTSSLKPDWAERAKSSVKVQVKRFDTLIRDTHQRCYVKLDVEGSEIQALIGMIEFLSNNWVILQMECSDDSIKDAMNILSPLGYELQERYELGNYIFSNIPAH